MSTRLFSEVKFFTKVGSLLFLGAAKDIRDISLNNSSAEGLSGLASNAIVGVGAVSGAAFGLSGIGKVLGEGINEIVQVSHITTVWKSFSKTFCNLKINSSVLPTQGGFTRRFYAKRVF